MINKTNDDRYKFDRVQLKIRYCDFQKLKVIFPAIEGESAMSYFRRLARFLQDLKLEKKI